MTFQNLESLEHKVEMRRWGRTADRNGEKTAIIYSGADEGVNRTVIHEAVVFKKRRAMKEFPFPGKHEITPVRNRAEGLRQIASSGS